MIKYGLDQNSPAHLGWELGTDKREVTRRMQRLGLETSWADGCLVKWIFYTYSGII